MKKLIIFIFIIVGNGFTNCSFVANKPLEQERIEIKKIHNAKFIYAYGVIKEHEGNYANVANDLGGETYRGIARNFHPNWKGWERIDKWKQENGKPKWNQEFDAMVEFYALDFFLDIWVKERWGEIRDQRVANYLFDFRVNGTVGIQIIQKAINDCGKEVEITNSVSESDIEAINLIEPNDLVRAVQKRRVKFYIAVARRNPSQMQFLSHWMERAVDI